MNALDFVAAGVVFETYGGHVFVRGPAGRPDLVEAIRAEVQRRVPRFFASLAAVRADVERQLGRVPCDGACELCADPLPVGRGGWCRLCALAARKARVAMGVLPDEPPPVRPDHLLAPPPAPAAPEVVPVAEVVSPVEELAPPPRRKPRIPHLPEAA